jgi:hypothetical protein
VCMRFGTMWLRERLKRRGGRGWKHTCCQYGMPPLRCSQSRSYTIPIPPSCPSPTKLETLLSPPSVGHTRTGDTPLLFPLLRMHSKPACHRHFLHLSDPPGRLPCHPFLLPIADTRSPPASGDQARRHGHGHVGYLTPWPWSLSPVGNPHHGATPP